MQIVKKSFLHQKIQQIQTMDGEKFQYMVEFTLPQLMGERFQKLIPYQRAKVNTYFNEGKLLSYALSMEKGKLWAIFLATSEREVEDMLHQLPLSRYLKHHINLLTFHHVLPERVPAFSMN
jgi:muconolactone delta-isomerase